MLQIGARVMLNPDIYNFTYGQGSAVYDEIGVVEDVYEMDDSDYQIVVRFPNTPYCWRGLGKEVLPVKGISKFFKNMQGQIDTKPISPIFGEKHVQS